jgi:hypothetical protein
MHAMKLKHGRVSKITDKCYIHHIVNTYLKLDREKAYFRYEHKRR